MGAVESQALAGLFWSLLCPWTLYLYSPNLHVNAWVSGRLHFLIGPSANQRAPGKGFDDRHMLNEVFIAAGTIERVSGEQVEE